MDLLTVFSTLFALTMVGALVGLLFVRSRRDPVVLLTLLLGCLLLLTASLVIGPLGGVGTPAIIVGLLALAWWLAAKALPSLGLATGRQPARWIVLGYAWYLILGYAVAHTRSLTDLEVSGADRSVIILAAMCGVALLAADGIDSRERLDTLLRRLVWLTTVFASFGVIQFFTGFDIVAYIDVPGLSLNRDLFSMGERSIFNRPGSTALHPIEFSVVLCMVLPLAIHYCLYDTSRRRRQVTRFCTGLIAAAIPMSLSRTGILALATVLVVMFVAWSWKRRLHGLIVGFFFTCGLYVVIPGLLGTIRSLFLNIETDPSFTARVDRTPRAMDLWAERFWLGRGTGTYSIEDYFLLDNQYYVTAIEHGILGIVVLVGFLVAGIWLATIFRRRGADGATSHLGQALAAPLASMLVTLATFDALFYRILTTLVFLFIGCAGALWRIEHHQLKRRPRPLHTDAGESTGGPPSDLTLRGQSST